MWRTRIRPGKRRRRQQRPDRRTFKIGDEPEGVSVEPSNGRVWVTSEEDGAVFVIDVAAHKVVKSVTVRDRGRVRWRFCPTALAPTRPSENGATHSAR